MAVSADVFVGKLTKDFGVEKGFKGQLTLPQGENIYIFVGYDGYMKGYLKESVGKDVVLVGNLRYPGMDARQHSGSNGQSKRRRDDSQKRSSNERSRVEVHPNR
jgi:hypothetical protein